MTKYDSEHARAIYDDITRRIESLYKERAEFFGHLAFFLVGMFFIWFVWLDYNEIGIRGAANFVATISVVWFLGLITHFVQWVFSEYKERAVQRELERVGLTRYYEFGTDQLTDKVKNEDVRLVRLSEDGELIGLDDEPGYDDGEHVVKPRSG